MKQEYSQTRHVNIGKVLSIGIADTEVILVIAVRICTIRQRMMPWLMREDTLELACLLVTLRHSSVNENAKGDLILEEPARINAIAVSKSAAWVRSEKKQKHHTLVACYVDKQPRFYKSVLFISYKVYNGDSTGYIPHIFGFEHSDTHGKYI